MMQLSTDSTAIDEPAPWAPEPPPTPTLKRLALIQARHLRMMALGNAPAADLAFAFVTRGEADPAVGAVNTGDDPDGAPIVTRTGPGRFRVTPLNNWRGEIGTADVMHLRPGALDDEPAAPGHVTRLETDDLRRFEVATLVTNAAGNAVVGDPEPGSCVLVEITGPGDTSPTDAAIEAHA